MSFRKYGGMSYRAKNNYVSNSVAVTANGYTTSHVGQPNSNIVFESNIDAPPFQTLEAESLTVKNPLLTPFVFSVNPQSQNMRVTDGSRTLTINPNTVVGSSILAIQSTNGYVQIDCGGHNLLHLNGSNMTSTVATTVTNKFLVVVINNVTYKIQLYAGS